MGLQSEDFHEYYRELHDWELARRYAAIKTETRIRRAKKKALANAKDAKKVAEMERRRTKAPRA